MRRKTISNRDLQIANLNPVFQSNILLLQKYQNHRRYAQCSENNEGLGISFQYRYAYINKMHLLSFLKGFNYMKTTRCSEKNI